MFVCGMPKVCHPFFQLPMYSLCTEIAEVKHKNPLCSLSVPCSWKRIKFQRDAEDYRTGQIYRWRNTEKGSPTQCILDKVYNALEDNIIDEDLKEFLIKKHPITPVLYTLPKSLFGGPTKSKSCFSNVGFTQEHNPRKEESPLWNLKRRLSSEEQHERRLQADMETRDSLYAQRKAERAMMREQMRSKYHLPKSAQDQQQMKAAGSPVQLPKELRNMALPGESRPHKSSLWGFLHPPSLAPQRKSAHPKMASLVPGTNCQLM
ncbi:hypothetical protein XELAEV_18040944mg [Xenopus laevis]|uniref:Uncharacterized protein n=1 Tax=Xenopus laevis TaxID=8355 RepID=A0A974H9T6_XENLA|nr:hypothetical protein XELAEV_18040944mg [Xenopus laevis]